MKLRNAIEQLGARSLRFQIMPFNYQPSLVKTNKVLEKTFVVGGEPPTSEILSDVARRIMAAIHAGQWQDVTKREWRQAAWCLWLKEMSLAHDPKVLEAYLGWLRLEGRISNYKRLVSAYLKDFDRNDKSFIEIANVLAGVVAEFDWPWREKHNQFHLFSMERGPQAVAAAVISSSIPIQEALDEVGLIGDLAFQGFGVESFRIALELYKSEPNARLLDRILEWSCLDDAVQFGVIRDAIANSLLLPWVNGGSELSQTMADTTRDFLLHHYKDPRLCSGLWNGVDEDARSVMLRWLAKASLEQFLQIVDDIASPELKTQWPYRRAFWEAYDRIGAIEEAWVAFADSGEQRARKMFHGKLNFGTLDSNGVQPNHAVLILKLSGLTIAEWSENGKCHVWLVGNEAAPKLYQSTQYTRSQLTRLSNNEGVIHSASDRGAWQRKVEKFIRDNTGIRLNQIDYMP
jgi:hypothetical protein